MMSTEINTRNQNMKQFIGIDPSLTGTAVAMLVNGDCGTKVFGSEPASGVAARMRRFEKLVNSVIQLVGSGDDSLVCIEGYSFGSTGGQAWDRVEYGGLLRYRLLASGAEVIEIPPTTLKVFAANKGGADKAAIAVALYKQYGREFGTDDEADAFALAHFAACLEDFSLCKTEGQRRAVVSILTPKVKAAKKRKV